MDKFQNWIKFQKWIQFPKWNKIPKIYQILLSKNFPKKTLILRGYKKNPGKVAKMSERRDSGKRTIST